MGRCTLKVCGNCVSPKEGSYTFHNSTSIDVEQRSTTLFIQTDRPVYKPGQKVIINIISVGTDLKPVDQKFIVYLADPKGTRVIWWDRLTPFCCGIVKTSYQLSNQPPLGTWSVNVELEGQIYNRSFNVDKYVLPKFAVTIQSPSFIKDWKECESVFITARYTYGRPVKGKLEVKIRIIGSDYYSHTTGPIVRKSGEITGTAHVAVCWSEMTEGMTLGDYFRGHLDVQAAVTTADGATVSVSDRSCVVNLQLVDIEFTEDTRRYFKPGLPYRGKVSVTYPDGSAAEDVTLEIRSEVSGKDSAIEEFQARRGIAQFDIPALPITAQSVWISAKVVKIGNRVASDHCLPIYLSLKSWYSPSNCHILIDYQQTEALTVGDEAKFRVSSTCPCNFTMHYEVVSRGNIVHSGVHTARLVKKRSPGPKIRFLTKESDGKENGKIGSRACNLSIKFPITHDMAPSSKLIVYYVRGNAEVVADTIQFNVQPEFKNKMSFELLHREVRPGGSISVKVRSESGSCVCIGAVDNSIHLLKPSHRLSAKQVFEEMKRYDISLNDEYDYHSSFRSAIRKRRSFIDSWMFSSRDSEFAFQEAGLMVLSDSARVDFQQDFSHLPYRPFYPSHLGHPLIAALTTSQRMTKQSNDPTKRVFFPETWIWTCFNSTEISSDETLNFTVPDTITSWMFEGLSLSPNHGLGLLDPPLLLTTFKRFFVDLTLPYSVIRNEEASIPVVLHNYLSQCVQVELTIRVSVGVTVASSPERQRICLGREQTETLRYVLVFALLGQHNLSVEARAFPDTNVSCCAESLASDVLQSTAEIMPLDSDLVERQVLVEAEGITRYVSRSIYFCPRERIYLSTPNKYALQYVEIPNKRRNVTFAVRASNDVHLSLSSLPEDNENTYDIVIGGHLNTQSWIIYSAKQGEKRAIAKSPGVLAVDEFRSFWVLWDFNQIKFGAGEVIADRTMILSLTVDHLRTVSYIGFSTGWGSTGDFRLWTKQDLSEFGDVIHLGLPNSFIKGSERAAISVIGDLLGPALTSIGRLLRMPSGCGEQNMIRFAPNVYILSYLQATKQTTPDLLAQAVDSLTQGYQTQLTYRRSDGSYSAFGDKDSSGNLWLTAFVLKSFSQAKAFIFVDDQEILKSASWLLSQQRSDGTFIPVGRLINNVIQGGASGVISLTAYVVTALLEIGKQTERASLIKAQLFLENQLSRMNDPYTTAIAAYALTRLKSPLAAAAAHHLSNMAIRQDGLIFWKNYGMEREKNNELNPTSQQTVVSSGDIETGGYALLTYVARGDWSSALPVVKWLSAQRNSLGGFSSTQDTCVALLALSEYASRTAFLAPVNLTVNLASVNMDLQETLDINGDNSRVLKRVTVPTIPTILFVSAEGEGCGLLQVDMSYNVPNPSGRSSFSLSVKVTNSDASPNGKGGNLQPTEEETDSDEGPGMLSFSNDDDDNGRKLNKGAAIRLRICTRWLHPGSSNMAVLELSLPSGFVARSESIESLIGSGLIKRSEVEGRVVLLYFDDIASSCTTCVVLEATRDHVIALTRPVPIRIYDYYEPIYEKSILYGIYDDCPPGQNCSRDTNSGDDTFPTPGDFPAELTEPCSCHRDCRSLRTSVCGSDGVIYQNWCHLEVAACLQEKHLDVVPLYRCHSGPDDEDSNEVLEDAIHRGSYSPHLESVFNQFTSFSPSPRVDEDETIPGEEDKNQTDLYTPEAHSSKYSEDVEDPRLSNSPGDDTTAENVTEGADGWMPYLQATRDAAKMREETTDSELPASVHTPPQSLQILTDVPAAVPDYVHIRAAGDSSVESFSDNPSWTVDGVSPSSTYPDADNLPPTFAKPSENHPERFHELLVPRVEDVTISKTVAPSSDASTKNSLSQEESRDWNSLSFPAPEDEEDDGDYYEMFKTENKNSLDNKVSFRQKAVPKGHTIYQIVDLDVVADGEDAATEQQETENIQYPAEEEIEEQNNVDWETNRVSMNRNRPSIIELTTGSSNYDARSTEFETPADDVTIERLPSGIIAEVNLEVLELPVNESKNDLQQHEFTLQRGMADGNDVTIEWLPAVPSEKSGSETEVIAELVTNGVAELVTEETGERVTKEVAEGITKEVPKVVTEEVSEGVNKEVTKMISQEVAERVTEEATEVVTERATRDEKLEHSLLVNRSQTVLDAKTRLNFTSTKHHPESKDTNDSTRVESDNETAVYVTESVKYQTVFENQQIGWTGNDDDPTNSGIERSLTAQPFEVSISTAKDELSSVEPFPSDTNISELSSLEPTTPYSEEPNTADHVISAEEHVTQQRPHVITDSKTLEIQLSTELSGTSKQINNIELDSVSTKESNQYKNEVATDTFARNRSRVGEKKAALDEINRQNETQATTHSLLTNADTNTDNNAETIAEIIAETNTEINPETNAETNAEPNTERNNEANIETTGAGKIAGGVVVKNQPNHEQHQNSEEIPDSAHTDSPKEQSQIQDSGSLITQILSTKVTSSESGQEIGGTPKEHITNSASDRLPGNEATSDPNHLTEDALEAAEARKSDSDTVTESSIDKPVEASDDQGLSRPMERVLLHSGRAETVESYSQNGFPLGDRIFGSVRRDYDRGNDRELIHQPAGGRD